VHRSRIACHCDDIMQRFLVIAGSVLSLAFSAVGCGDGAEGDTGRVETHEASGSITYKGKPLADAIVSFSPKGSHPVALGRTDSSGNYSLRTYEDDDGAAAGDYVVLITKSAPSSTSGPAPHDAKSTGPGPAAHQSKASATASKSEIPVKYNTAATSDLTATVKEDGENTFNFELKD
jgi:hypothetical protein